MNSKKIKLSVLMALGLFALFAISASGNDDGGNFNANEIQVTLGTGYSVDINGNSLPNAFKHSYDFNLEAGAQYYVTRNFGLEASLPFYQTKGVSVSEVQFGPVVRLPLSSSTPILRNVAPYVGIGGVYSWEASEHWAYEARAGVELRLNPKWGFSVEGRYRNNTFHDWQNGSVSVAGALHLIL